MSNSNPIPERYYVCNYQENQWCIIVLKDIVDTLETGYYFRMAVRYAMGSIQRYNGIVTVANATKVKWVGKRISKILKDAHDRNYANYVERGKEYVRQGNAFNANYKQYIKKRQQERISRLRGGPYIPRTKCGNWAILVTLAELVDAEYVRRWDRYAQPDNGPTIRFDAATIKHESQPWSVASMYQSVRGHTAFTGIWRLIEAKYVESYGDDEEDMLYQLTPAGYEIGLDLLEEYYVNQDKNTENDVSDDSETDDEKAVPGQKRSRKSSNNGRLGNKKPKLTSKFGNVMMAIVDQKDKKYKLTDPIPLNGKRYLLYLNIDPRETPGSQSKRINIYNDLNADPNFPVSNRILSIGDFGWILVNEDFPNDNEEILVLPYLIERKTWRDLYLSIFKDGRYEQQKYRMSYVMDNDEYMVGGRKIYLMEGRPDKDQVAVSRKEQCLQSVVGTDVIDGFHVYSTATKQETLRTLVNWTFMMRHWINGGYSKGMDGYESKGKYLFDVTSLISLATFNKNTKDKLIDDLSPQMKWMEQLLKVPGCSEKDAYYISKKYPTMGELCDAYDECKEKYDSIMEQEEKQIVLHELQIHNDCHIDGFYTCAFVSSIRGPCGRLNAMEMDYCPKCGKKRPEFRAMIGDINENKNENENRIIENKENIYHPEEMLFKTVQVCGEWE
eukprot:3658_1